MLNAKDLAAGGIFIAFGLFFGGTALTTLDIGSAHQMGPAYFPLLLSTALILLGVGTMARGLLVPGTAFGAFPVRAVIMVSLAPIVFALTVRGFGLFVAVVAAAFVTALASQKMGLLRAVTISVALSAFCVIIFTYALRLPLPVLGPWLSFG